MRLYELMNALSKHPAGAEVLLSVSAWHPVMDEIGRTTGEIGPGDIDADAYDDGTRTVLTIGCPSIDFDDATILELAERIKRDRANNIGPALEADPSTPQA